MLLRYCSGNIDILNRCTFSEILEIIEFVINQESDEQLLKAYEASYAALQSITFADFKKRVYDKFSATYPGSNPQSAEEIEEKVAHYIDDFKWEAV
ncbi:MAG: hypothetical protein ACI4HN_09055 [Ruminococcus sp.]